MTPKTRTLDVGPCDGLWRHCAHKCDMACDHDVWCADCERKYATPAPARWGARFARLVVKA